MRPKRHESLCTSEATWRHLNFFQHEAGLTARVPRISSPECGLLKLQSVPRAYRDSGFTLLFEAMIMLMARSMAVKTIATIVGEHDTRIWRIVHHYVDQARAKEDYPAVTSSGIGSYFVNAQLSCDKFHVMQIINNAVDEVRRQEQKERPELKKTGISG
ncbi:MAG TPA: hypothetical protein DEB17_00025 [Chlorobaculum sp.]|uniref:helix-turn-helix domain-containing protein n=1 Tax=Chlorobaculum tepidum TaxID=1097 RepID=UPI000326864E|nr:helix-turn-helix domain-containing protein [Chlorobaculum tepidum]HBU22385.1 hypothetical protein [Chlorobaculum sp.]